MQLNNLQLLWLSLSTSQLYFICVTIVWFLIFNVKQYLWFIQFHNITQISINIESLPQSAANSRYMWFCNTYSLLWFYGLGHLPSKTFAHPHSRYPSIFHSSWCLSYVLCNSDLVHYLISFINEPLIYPNNYEACQFKNHIFRSSSRLIQIQHIHFLIIAPRGLLQPSIYLRGALYGDIVTLCNVV